MATDLNITMKQYNGVDYDTLYPKTAVEQIDGLDTKFGGYYTKTESSNLFLPKTGGTMGGILDMNGNRITNVPNPISANDVANKGYCDNGQNIKFNLLQTFDLARDSVKFNDFTFTNTNVFGLLFNITLTSNITGKGTSSKAFVAVIKLLLGSEYNDPYKKLLDLRIGDVDSTEKTANVNGKSSNIFLPFERMFNIFSAAGLSFVKSVSINTSDWLLQYTTDGGSFSNSPTATVKFYSVEAKLG